MLASLFDSESAEGALRKPEVSIEFDTAGALAGSLAAISGAGDPLRDNLVALDCSMSMSPGPGVVHLYYSWSDSLAVELEQEGTIGLGFGDGQTETVMQGKISQLRQRIDGTTRVTLSNGGAALARLRVNQAYEQQTAGDVVTDLAQRAGVSIEAADSGIDLAYFVVDDRRSAAQHLQALARASGFVTYLTPDNELYFGPANQSQSAKTLTYGVNLLQTSVQRTQLPVSKVVAVGEGSAGSDGQDAWCWLAKQRDAVAAEVGEGDAGRTVYSGAWRNADASASAAAGHMSAVKRLALTGQLVALGSPEVAVGNLVDIEAAPQADINGQFLVTAVRHRYSKGRGFLSEIRFCEAATADAGGLF